MDIETLLNDYFKKQEQKYSKEIEGLLYKYTSEYTWSIINVFYKEAMRKYPFKRKKLQECMKLYESELHYYKCKEITKREFDIFKKTIQRSSLPINLKVYRGTSSDILKKSSIIKRDKLNGELNIGDKIINLVPWSTSLDYREGVDFSYDAFLEIYLPQSSPGIWLKPLSKLPHEKEVLLPPNMCFEIVNSYYDEDLPNVDSEGNPYPIKINHFILKPARKR